MTHTRRVARVSPSRRMVLLLVACAAFLAASVASAASSEVVIPFNSATLPYPDGTILTTQLADHFGVVFSADDSDLPPAYRLSLGPQENVVRFGPGETELTNPFRIFFLSQAVKSVSASIEDRNTDDQLHTLTAFSSTGSILDAASFQDGIAGDLAGVFTLTVSSNHPIAYVVEIEQPFGAEVLRELRYQTAGSHKRPH